MSIYPIYVPSLPACQLASLQARTSPTQGGEDLNTAYLHTDSGAELAKRSIKIPFMQPLSIVLSLSEGPPFPCSICHTNEHANARLEMSKTLLELSQCASFHGCGYTLLGSRVRSYRWPLRLHHRSIVTYFQSSASRS